MYHFFVDKQNIDTVNNRVIIEGGDVNHIRNVLRMRPGEEISVGTGEDDNEYRCEIESLEEDRVTCILRFIKSSDVESPADIILFQGLPKADKMEMIIQKCVELGVAEIVPVSCERCIVKLDDKKADAKVKRWQGIAEAAAKQSKRSVIPGITMPLSMKDALKKASGMDIKIIPYELARGMEKTAEVFGRISGLKTENKADKTENNTENNSGNNTERRPQIAVFIGPEGGFTEEEITLAKECGVEPISLGKRILRTETAGLAVISWIDFCLEVQ